MVSPRQPEHKGRRAPVDLSSGEPPFWQPHTPEEQIRKHIKASSQGGADGLWRDQLPATLGSCLA